MEKFRIRRFRRIEIVENAFLQIEIQNDKILAWCQDEFFTEIELTFEINRIEFELEEINQDKYTSQYDCYQVHSSDQKESECL